MRSKGAQVSLFDTYKDVADSYENNKPRLFRLLDELIDWDALIPQRFFCAFYQTMGRPRVYGLVSFLKMLILQRIFGYIADSQLLVTLRHSREMRDFCELKKVPDAAKLTRFNHMQCGQLKREVSKARLAVIAEFARGLLDGAGIMTPGDYLNPIAFLNCYGKNVFTSG